MRKGELSKPQKKNKQGSRAAGGCVWGVVVVAEAKRGPVLEKRALESVTGKTGENGGKADETEREIQTEDWDRESRETGSRRVQEREW